MKYKGEWSDGVFNGEGELDYANGDKYIGTFKMGKKDGKGIFTWKSGPYYSGEWKDGVRHGNGVHTQANGINFNVTYKKGVRIDKIVSLVSIFAFKQSVVDKAKNDLKELGIEVEEEESSEISL